MTTRPRILIACIGNIFLGDDAFGVEVARRLMPAAPLPDGVRVVDFGIRGLDLTYALLDGCDIAILVDASPRGHAPGTLYVIEPDPPTSRTPSDSSPERTRAAGVPLVWTPTEWTPSKFLMSVADDGRPIFSVLVVGCEPTPIQLRRRNADESLSPAGRRPRCRRLLK